MKRFFKNNHVGLEDENGNVLLEAKYNYLWIFGEYCLVNIYSSYGVIRMSDRKEIVPVKYSYARIFDGYTIVKEGCTNKYGIYKNDGTILAEPVFDDFKISPIVATVRCKDIAISIYP